MKKLISLTAALAMAGGVLLHPATHLHAAKAQTLPVSHEKNTQASVPMDSQQWQSDPIDWSSIPIEGSIEEAAGQGEAVITPRKVIGQDERQIVADTTVQPYSAVCKLLMAFEKNGQLHAYVGTGFLIADDMVMTAAHNLYDHEAKLGRVKSVQVIPGANASSKPFGITTESAMFYVPQAWYSGHNTDYDFGLIRLSEPLGAKAGKFKLVTFDSPVQENLTLAGYPYHAGENTDTMNQYKASGASQNRQGARTLFHTIDSTSGQSGSPLFNERGEVGAIHTFASTAMDANGATMIDSYVIEYVNSVTSLDKPVYRLYNPNSGEHFYTMDYNELASLVRSGWHDEGMAWRNQADGIPVYRLYNPNAGDHHYTTDSHEVEFLLSEGWNAEGIAWRAASTNPDKTVFRLYNPNAQTGAHHFTTNAKERDFLAANGWNDEGIAFDAR